MEVWIAKAGRISTTTSVPVAIGEEAEVKLIRQNALLQPASWEVGARTRSALAQLMLHLPAFEMKSVDASTPEGAGLMEAFFRGYAMVLAEVPEDLVLDACKTAMTMATFKRLPTPAELLEVVIARKSFILRKNRRLLLEKLAQCPRKDPTPSVISSEADIAAGLARLGIKVDGKAERTAKTDEEDLR